MPDDEPLKPDPILTRAFILRDTSVHTSTLSQWVKEGLFPEPLVLNPGAAREICGWLASDYARWKASRPRRAPKAISPNSYSLTARAKARETRAAKRAAAALVKRPRL